MFPANRERQADVMMHAKTQSTKTGRTSLAAISRRLAVCVLGAVLILVASGCQSTSRWRFPALTELPNTLPWRKPYARQQAWDVWGRQNLQDGDVIFVMGESRILLGFLNFSKFSAEIANSEFSHVGVIAIEEGQPVVYDVISEGTLRRPFDEYVTDRRVWSVAVKRLEPEFQHSTRAVVDFCRAAYRQQGKFDNDFRLDNDRYYCAELVEAAFRHAGRPLSEPVRIESLPGFHRLSPVTVQLIETATPVTRDREVYLPGNTNYGLWSSQCLITVLEKTGVNSPPVAETIARLPHPPVQD